MYTPNIYADAIEWFHRNVPRRRLGGPGPCTRTTTGGTAVAAAELGVMAGADRIEGTLFGKRRADGNVDVVNLAGNMFSQGVDPKLDSFRYRALRRVAEHCNRLPVEPAILTSVTWSSTSFSGSQPGRGSRRAWRACRRHTRHGSPIILPNRSKHVGRSYEARHPGQQPVRQGGRGLHQ